MSFKYYEDPILGKGRAEVTGGTGGGGGTDYVGGYRITIAGGTISNDRYMDIESVTWNSVTMQAGHAYKVYATTSAVTLNTETIPSNKFGLEGHLEIFVAGTGYVVTGANVVLSEPLEPDAVNNCTVRFHDGLAIISVEDHIAGYIVTVASGTTSGSLYYGLGTASNEYIAVDASLNGQVLDLGGVTTSNGEKHVVGNGYTETVVSGGINCTSKTTFANLGMNGVVVSSGTLTLGDVYIPNGATVAVSGGGLAIEKVTGNGGVIDLGGTHPDISSMATARVSGCSVTNALNQFGGVFYGYGVKNALYAKNCVFAGNSASTGGGVIYLNEISYASLDGCMFSNNTAQSNKGGAITVTQNSELDMVNCIVSGNSATTVGHGGGGIFVNRTTRVTIQSSLVSGNSAVVGKDMYIAYNAAVTVLGSTIGEIGLTSGGGITLAGSNVVDTIKAENVGASLVGTVTISSGASINLTSSIAPGGGIVVDGACVVNGVEIAGGTYTSIVSSGGSAVVNE